MKNLILTFLLWSTFIQLNAQQDPMYTQFFSNKIVVNPAYAGTREAFSATSLSRIQWTGIEGAPRTTSLSLHTPIEKWNTGLGLSFVYDQLGIQRSYVVKLAYAYRIKTKLGIVSLGVDGHMRKQDMLWESSNPLEAEDYSIPYGTNTVWSPNFGAGVYLYKKNYYVGLSVPQLVQNELDYSTGGSSISNTQKRHYFAMAGMHIPILENVALKPAVLMKYELNSPVEFDLNVMGIFSERFWLGMTYRTNDSFDFIAQYHLENGLRIGYSYDFTLSQLNRVNNGSHEIMIGFDFNKKNKGVYNPRYF